MSAPDYSSRVMGMFFGGLGGEMLGAPFENLRRDQIEEKSVGQIYSKRVTDDGMMTIELAETLSTVADPTVDDFHSSFAQDTEPRGYSQGTLRILKDLKSYYSGDRADPPKPGTSDANGSVMRICPFALLPDNETTKRLIRRCLHYTHNNRVAKSAAIYYVGLLRTLLQGKDLDQKDAFICRTREVGKSSADIHRALFGKTDHFAIKAMDCIAVALAVYFRYEDNPLEGILEAVRLGGDADTVAKLAGELLGARNGSDFIELLPVQHLSDFERATAAINSLASLN